MRSRYSGYVKGLWQYIVGTTHPDNPLLTDEAAQAGRPTLKDDVLATIDKLGFERLKVLSVEPGKDEDEGFVTFQVCCGAGWGCAARRLRCRPVASCLLLQAWFKNRGQLGQRAQGWHTQTFVERSRFLREDGKWLYGARQGCTSWRVEESGTLHPHMHACADSQQSALCPCSGRRAGLEAVAHASATPGHVHRRSWQREPAAAAAAAAAAVLLAWLANACGSNDVFFMLHL